MTAWSGRRRRSRTTSWSAGWRRAGSSSTRGFATRSGSSAKNLRSSSSPSGPPKRLKGVELAAAFDSARELGGDFHDYLAPESNTLVIAVGDKAREAEAAGADFVGVEHIGIGEEEAKAKFSFLLDGDRVSRMTIRA